MKTFFSGFTTTIGAILLGLSFWYGLPTVFIIIAGIVLGIGWFLAEFASGRVSK